MMRGLHAAWAWRKPAYSRGFPEVRERWELEAGPGLGGYS